MEEKKINIKDHKPIIIGVVGLIVLIVLIIIFTSLGGNDDNNDSGDVAETTLTQEEGAESGSNQDETENSTDSGDIITTQEDESEVGQSDSDKDDQVVSNVNDDPNQETPDLVFPTNEQEAGEVYCQLLFSPTNDKDKYDDCIANVSCQPEAEEIAGNFTCKSEENAEENFAGGVEKERLKE